GEELTGGRWVQASYDYFSLPLYVKEQTILPLGNQKQHPVYDYSSDLTFRVYGLKTEQSCSRTLYGQTGKQLGKITVSHQEQIYQVAVEGITGKFTLDIVGEGEFAITDGQQRINIKK
ncbi:alpha-glucosidase (family GH31 glycosyl hydrolase), partial [Gracilibacillus alcaliphilus]|nr:alpha-glucosidase (family GH31 glycosyl hydrolase) [Gracilibacillus alcaliphilus]